MSEALPVPTIRLLDLAFLGFFAFALLLALFLSLVRFPNKLIALDMISASVIAIITNPIR